MSWTQVFVKGFDLFISEYTTKKADYFERELQLCDNLQVCFELACKKESLESPNIQREVTLIGKTRLDFLLGKGVSLEVKFEPDYPDMPKSRKPVTNATLKTIDPEVARVLALDPNEAGLRVGEIEHDFLKLLAHKRIGVLNNYLFCLDEDGRLFRNLEKSFRTKAVKRIVIDWKTIKRGKDGKIVYYFLWLQNDSV